MLALEQRVQNQASRNNGAGLEAAARAVLAVKLDIQAEQKDERNQDTPDHARNQVMAKAFVGAGVA